MRHPYQRTSLALTSVAVVAALAVVPFASAQAQAPRPAASAFGVNVQANGTNVVPPTPAVAVATPPGDATNTVVNVPASPVAVNGTLTATANVHRAADIPSGLTVVQQAVAGPYNGRGLAQIEGLGLVFAGGAPGVPLVSAALVRSEAAVVCGATPRFTANSEIVDLRVAGTAIPVNAPAQTLIDAISAALATSGVAAVADVDRNVVTQIAGGGIAVDALVVRILSAAGATPLAEVRLAHSEVTSAACTAPPQCSDGVDNDGDVRIDTADPGCHTDGNAANAASFDPNDNDERNAPQCSDGIDNDGDVKSDTADPGCHSDGDATNAATFVASDDNERDEAARATLPRTGAEAAFPLLGAGFAALAAFGFRLRSRIIG
ncbi:MAG TPA: hypothetical protein VNB24_10045 [Acidimicrobiales bacterium]|nr:hypothetical protein [Acidimicrobiales bacterium]